MSARNDRTPDGLNQSIIIIIVDPGYQEPGSDVTRARKPVTKTVGKNVIRTVIAPAALTAIPANRSPSKSFNLLRSLRIKSI